jgi:hypothetical protein
MCAMAFDRLEVIINTRKNKMNFFFFSEGSQSAQYCFNFYVSDQYVCACPGDPCITTTTTLVKKERK